MTHNTTNISLIKSDVSLTGAGIFLIEKYKGNVVAVLFGKKKYIYDDPGGMIDSGETYAQAACRETREETANLINIDSRIIDKIAIPILSSKYVSYILYVDSINRKDYLHNVRIIFDKCKLDCWKENNSMVRIDLRKLLNAAANNNYKIEDIRGNLVNVRERTIRIINQSRDILNNILLGLSQPVSLYKTKVENNRMNCLIGTYSYKPIE
jgi:8-oxo-dGTP pyrophosphatase MutT (NUDIX family)